MDAADDTKQRLKHKRNDFLIVKEIFENDITQPDKLH